MKAVIQRVSSASVQIESGEIKTIKKGLAILLGVSKEDTEKDALWMSQKIGAMRIFEDGEGKMNLSVKDIQGELLIVSQFTLIADTRKGNRPSFNDSAPPVMAIPLYESFIKAMKGAGFPVKTGKFGDHMALNIQNDGPVTIILDSRNRN